MKLGELAERVEQIQDSFTEQLNAMTGVEDDPAARTYVKTPALGGLTGAEAELADAFDRFMNVEPPRAPTLAADRQLRRQYADLNGVETMYALVLDRLTGVRR